MVFRAFSPLCYHLGVRSPNETDDSLSIFDLVPPVVRVRLLLAALCYALAFGLLSIGFTESSINALVASVPFLLAGTAAGLSARKTMDRLKSQNDDAEPRP